MTEWTPVPDQLLATKFFVPPAAQPTIARPRLTDLLADSLHRRLTLVSAPAGFGKTTLVASWLNERAATAGPDSVSPRPPAAGAQVAWVSLDEVDNQVIRFWTYVVTALDTYQPGLSAPVLSALQTEGSEAQEYLLTTLINALLPIREPLLLVLDDYHLISDPAIHAGLSFLLLHLPPALHIIILTRTDPPLPLSRLRALGQLLEIRTELLRCRHDEVAAFLATVLKLPLAADSLRGIAERTEGWFVGLQLIGLAAQGHADPQALLDDMLGSHRYILDYLTDEVLHRQPEAIQTFLLHTSLFDRLSADLCNAVLQQRDSQRVLEYLERSNLFLVPLDGQRRWYRYHQLFAEALRYRLHQGDPAIVHGLHLRASVWYEAQHSSGEAIRHALAAQAWERAADLIDRHTGGTPWLRFVGEQHELREWLAQIPEPMVRARPHLCLIYAQAFLNSAPPSTIESWIQAAEAPLRASTALPGGADMLGQVLAFRAQQAAVNGDPQTALALSGEALDALAAENRIARAVAHVALALAYSLLGEVPRIIQHYQAAYALAQGAGETAMALTYLGSSVGALIVHGRLHEAFRLTHQIMECDERTNTLRYPASWNGALFQADLLREWNRLDEAWDLAAQTIVAGEQLAAPWYVLGGSMVQLRVARARADWAAAQAILARIDQFPAPFWMTWRATVLLNDEVQLWLTQGQLARAVQWAESLALQDPAPYPIVQERQATARARVVLAQQRPLDALALLDPLLVTAQAAQRWSHVIELRILEVLAHQQRGAEARALAALREAVRLAEPEGYIRTFVDQGPSLGRMIDRLCAQERLHGPTPYLDLLLDVFGRESGPAQPGSSRVSSAPVPRSMQPLIEPLSERELEILQALARGASNQEIAEEFVLSLNTVKRHVSNIMAKLSANNRTQAVAQARALNLIRNS